MAKTLVFKEDKSHSSLYLEFLLRALGCTNFKSSAADGNLFCGFRSEDSEILQHLRVICPVMYSYQEKQNYIIAFGWESLKKKIDEYRKLFREHGLSCYGLGDKGGSVAILDFEVFANATIDNQLGKGFVALKEQEMLEKQKMAFLMAQHKRVGAESMALNFSQTILFDKKLLGSVFEFMASEKPKKISFSPFFKPHPHVIGNNNAEIKSEEKLKEAVLSLKTALQAKIDVWFPWLNRDSDRERKRTQVEFLGWILFFKDTNPNFTIKTCLACAKHYFGDLLYQEVLLGDASKSMHDLLMKIKLEESTIPSKPNPDSKVGQKHQPQSGTAASDTNKGTSAGLPALPLDPKKPQPQLPTQKI